MELAQEIQMQSQSLKLDFDIFTFGYRHFGSFLAKYSKFKVFTCACVGDIKYLKNKF